MGVPFLRATMMRPKSSGRSMRELICTMRSCSSERIAPTGKSWFSLRTAATTCSAVTPKASMLAGFKYRLISRLLPPTKVTEPTPRTFSRRFLSTCSDQLVNSTALSLSPSGMTASDHTARLEGSKRSTRGSLTSVRSRGRSEATFSRTSSAALRPSICSWTSMITTDWFS